MFNFNKKHTKYEFYATTSAPKDFPCEVVKGDFYLADESFIYIPKGRVLGATGWGGGGALHVVGSDLKALPVAVAVTWVSYVEKKFYHGKFNLDYDLISNYFQKGYLNSRINKQETFNRIEVGIAPGGFMVIWVSGSSRKIEVGRFKATETEVTKAEFIPSAIMTVDEWLTKYRIKKLPPEYQNETYYNNIPFGKWENYRKKYIWKPTIQFENGGESRTFLVSYFNGEKLFAKAENKEVKDYKERALPKYISLNWKDKTNNLFGAEIQFGAMDNLDSSEEYKPIEQEISEAYNKLFNEKKAEQAELVFKIDKYNSHIQVFLKSEQDSIELKKMKVNTFKRTK